MRKEEEVFFCKVLRGTVRSLTLINVKYYRIFRYWNLEKIYQQVVSQKVMMIKLEPVGNYRAQARVDHDF